MCQNHMHKIKKKTYAQSQNLTSPGLSADCDGLALGHPHMHSRVSSRTGWTPWPTENTLSRIRRTQLPVRWKKSFLLCVFSTFYSNSACASLEELMFVLNCSRALYFTASSSKQQAFSMFKLCSVCDEISFNSIHKEVTGQGFWLAKWFKGGHGGASWRDPHPGFEWDRTDYIYQD